MYPEKTKDGKIDIRQHHIWHIYISYIPLHLMSCSEKAKLWEQAEKIHNNKKLLESWNRNELCLTMVDKCL